MLRIFCSLLIVAPTLFGFTKALELSCPIPANLGVVSKSSGSIAFDWDDCTGGCTQYLVKYYRYGDSFQSQVFTVGVSNISFSSLPAGTYDFSFAIDCGSTAGNYVVIQEIIMN